MRPESCCAGTGTEHSKHKPPIYPHMWHTCIQKRKQMLNVILTVHKYSPAATRFRSESWISAGGTKLTCLQVFLLEEDLSIDCVGAGGCGVGGGRDRGLLSRSDKLQLCICQALFLWYSRSGRSPWLSLQPSGLSRSLCSNGHFGWYVQWRLFR